MKMRNDDTIEGRNVLGGTLQPCGTRRTSL